MKNFVVPENTLIRAAQLRSKDFIEYLLSIEDNSIFLPQFAKALMIAEKHGDEERFSRSSYIWSRYSKILVDTLSLPLCHNQQGRLKLLHF